LGESNFTGTIYLNSRFVSTLIAFVQETKRPAGLAAFDEMISVSYVAEPLCEEQRVRIAFPSSQRLAFDDLARVLAPASSRRCPLTTGLDALGNLTRLLAIFSARASTSPCFEDSCLR
jgi:hypothetical protein